MKISTIFILSLLLLVQNVMAQNNAPVEMANAMRDSGKIYVVVAVMSIVFIGLIVYLFTIDKRVKKIEKGN
ncbi:MAG: CcmD family protein [Daejeonella sp.]